VVLVASSGHELGHLGLRAWLGAHEALARRAHAFLHLGANFVAAGGEVVVQPSSEAYAQLACDAFTRAGRSPDIVVPVGAAPLGEAREIADRPYLSVLGTNPRFHTPDDRWPYAVDLDRGVILCRALVEVAKRL
jgi:hypothetical protein